MGNLASSTFTYRKRSLKTWEFAENFGEFDFSSSFFSQLAKKSASSTFYTLKWLTRLKISKFNFCDEKMINSIKNERVHLFVSFKRLLSWVCFKEAHFGQQCQLYRINRNLFVFRQLFFQWLLRVLNFLQNNLFLVILY